MKKKRGFTLLETLLVVGILTILMAIGIVNVVKYQRSLCQLELDGIAKEIFVAAQNHLSDVYGQNYLGLTKNENAAGNREKDLYTPVGVPTASPLDEDGVYYFVVNDRSALTEDSLLGLMLPAGAVDETVRQGGSYIIRYNKDAGLVLDVFYARPDGERFGHTLQAEDYAKKLMTFDTGTCTVLSRAERKDYSFDETAAKRAVIGYYGGVETEPVVTEGLPKPVLRVINGDRLEAAILNPSQFIGLEKYPDVKLKLRVEGVSGGAVREFPFYPASPEAVIFDDVTDSGGNHHFAEVFKSIYNIDDSKDFIPGEDIRVTAIAYDEATGVQSESDTKTENSLFAKVSGETAFIGNFRHLENLDSEISGRSVTLKSAEQTTDLDWKNSWYSAYNITKSFDGTTKADKGYYYPVSLLSDYHTALTYDGKNFKVSGISVSNAGESGMFGTVTGSTVKNLILADFDIKAASGNAGALAGSANGKASGEDYTFFNILAYQTEGSEEKDITAVSCAGGLVGYAKNCTIDACAAALCVSSTGVDGIAGGLVGKMDGGTVSDSFSGGHTNNAQYVTSFPGINVYAQNGTAGGLIGSVEGTGTIKIEYAYSTCSASGNTAAGFIGMISSDSTVNVKNVYSTGYVDGTAAAYFFNGEEPVYQGKNYYLSNLVSLSDQSKNSENTTDFLKGVNGSKNVGTESPEPDFILLTEKRKTAYVYDAMLRRDFESKFYFKTIAQLHNDDTYRENILQIQSHYGDWQVPDLKGIVLHEENGDVLLLFTEFTKTTLENLSFTDNTATATLGVKGKESGTFDLFEIQITETSGNYSAEIVKVWRDGDDKWTEKANFTESMKRYFPEVSVETVGGKQQLQIELDDIKEQHQHFAERFPAMKPGEDIELYFVDGEQDIAGINSVVGYKPAVCNSLFGTAEEDEPYTNAIISTVRHLQNLDPMVSGVCDDITSATLKNDLTFNTSVYPKIFSADGTTYLSDGGFYALFNNKLTTFDGENHTLSNFSFRSPTDFTVGDASGEHSGSAGLFRYVKNSLTVKDLQLLDCTAKTASGHAGMAAAEVAAGGSLTLDTVLVRDNPDAAITDSGAHIHVSSANNYSAGGLVGSATGSIMLKNCGASVYVTAGGSGNAGGLIGQTFADITVVNSYTGGRTEGGKYYNIDTDIDSGNLNSANWWNGVDEDGVPVKAAVGTKAVSSRWNISQTGTGAAGGLIGYCECNGNTKIAQTFNAASVWGVTAGGLIGKTSGTNHAYFGDRSGITINGTAFTGSVYTIAPVTEHAGTSGAVIGVNQVWLVGTNVYYLPQVDKNYGTKEPSIVGTGIEDQTDLKVTEAYYDIDQEDSTGTGGSVCLIAAKYQHSGMSTLEIGTVNFDNALAGREYPYSIWTSLPFCDGYKAPTGTHSFGTYFGDWQPILPEASVTYNVEFLYADPKAPGTKKSLAAEPFGTQTLHIREDNTLYIPDIPKFEEYESRDTAQFFLSVNGNEITPPTGGFQIRNGQLTIPADKVSQDGDYQVLISYQPVPASTDESGISFYYNTEGKCGNGVAYTEIAEHGGLAYLTAKWADVKELVTPPYIPGYTFVGWYQDKACTIPWTDRVILTSTASGGSKAYAKYEKIGYYYVTVDFMYTIADSGLGVYPLDTVGGPIRIRQQENQKYDAVIPLPDPVISGNTLSFDTFTAEKESGENASITGDTGTKMLTIKAESEAHFVVTYILSDESQDPSDKKKFEFTLTDKLEYTKKVSGAYVYDGTHTETVDLGTVAAYGNENDEPQAPNVTPAVYDGLYLASEDVDLVHLTITRTYKRQTHYLHFDTRGGNYIKPLELKTGQPLSTVTLPTSIGIREGFMFKGEWSVPHRRSDKTDLSGGWSALMPNYDIETDAVWVLATAKYTIEVWQENFGIDNNNQETSVYEIVEYDVRYAGSDDYIVKDVGGKMYAYIPPLGQPYDADAIKNELLTVPDGFELDSEESAEALSGVELKEDNSTVLKVYFKRRMATIHVLNTDYSVKEIKTGKYGSATTGWNGYANMHFNFCAFDEEIENPQTTHPTFDNRVVNILPTFYAPGYSGKLQIYMKYTGASCNMQTTAVKADDLVNGKPTGDVYTLPALMNVPNAKTPNYFYVYEFIEGYDFRAYGKNNTWTEITNLNVNVEPPKDKAYLFTRAKAKWYIEYMVETPSGMEHVTDGSGNEIRVQVAGTYGKYGLTLTDTEAGSLKNAISTAVGTFVGSQYTWDNGYYMNHDCTVGYNFGGSKLLVENVIYIRLKSATKYTVHFNLGSGESFIAAADSSTIPAYTVGDVEAVDSDYYKLKVLDGYSLDDAVSTSSGELKPEYTPQKKDAVFSHWKYTENGSDVWYTPAMAVKKDIELTAVWEPVYIPEQRPVTVKCLNEAGGSVLKTVTLPDKYECREVAVIVAPNLENYYTVSSVKHEYIPYPDTENGETFDTPYEVTFYYREIVPWEYTVEYYVRYSSYLTPVSLTGYTLASGKQDILISAATAESYNNYETVYYTVPAGYENYRLESIEFENPDITSPAVTKGYDRCLVHPTETKDTAGNSKPYTGTDIYAKVRFYIEPDPSCLKFDTINISTIYNGSVAAVSDAHHSGSLPTYKAPVGYTVRVIDTHRIFQSGTDTEKQPIDAGVYRPECNVLLEVTRNADNTKSYYLILQDDNPDHVLRITRRSVTVISASATQTVSDKPLVESDFIMPDTSVVIPTDVPADLKAKFPQITNYAGQRAWYALDSASGYGDILLIGPNDGENPPIVHHKGDAETGDGINVLFSVEAFRQGVGSADNSYTYVLNENTAKHASDYQITTVFGTLTVKPETK